MNEEQPKDTGPVPSEIIPPPPPEVPSGFTLWLRKALRWTLAFVVVFALGTAANWWFQVRPKTAAIADLTSQLETASQELETLRPKAAEAETMSAALDQAEREVLALQALVQVNEARISLAQGDATGARMPLLLAESKLAGLGTRVSSAQAETITGVRERLALALQELQNNAFAAERDLEIMANDLNQLVREIASE
ncbi:MAG TPA: hypothetical protein VFI11_00060 [Anaerolineales bacterium]|nr:hypothetical protein [Anaerolineales bacterium]